LTLSEFGGETYELQPYCQDYDGVIIIPSHSLRKNACNSMKIFLTSQNLKIIEIIE